MILIFGGTTEGRSAVRVIEQAGKTYYYSTKSNHQNVICEYGIRLTGGMEVDRMITFCREKEIRLIIDAGHPFASLLHQNIATASASLKIPVIRYERIYPERNDAYIWCDDYQDVINKLESHQVQRLLALSGVNTIAPLRPYWERHTCWFRILNREESLQTANRQGFPEKQLLFLDKADETNIISQLQADAILTKESGYSGTFVQKTATAEQSGIPVFVIKRPALPKNFINVYGEVGLRIKTERLVPGFFALRTGYTTGVYATAAAKAAATALITKKNMSECIVRLPRMEPFDNNNTHYRYGEPVTITIASIILLENKACCSTIKDAGDDPDVTNKICIKAEAYWADETSDKEITNENPVNQVFPKDILYLAEDLPGNKSGNVKIMLRRGKGIGVVTLPGLGIDIGEPAINATPRQMIRNELINVLNQYSIQNQTLVITLSVPEGEEIAKRTFNPKLGIEGGISIIGTSGVVHPFSNEAFVATIRKEIEIAKAIGCHTIMINSGAKSERFLKKQYPLLLPQAFIHYGNFIGETLKFASELQIPHVIMGIMIGKAVKLAEGALDTHSKKGTMNKSFIKSLALSAGCNKKDIQKIDHINLARELWDIFSQKEEKLFLTSLIYKCYEQCSKIYSGGKLIILIIKEDGILLSPI